ncbi:hypothetical protein [Anaerobaca lacustris]|uniref:Uncharacterized protein n=1 Tax=Anaerobaca lacustris TaxID=3044600 RepID=A0AAW6U3M6_9BACT|nr:hypothetical protein [Sedimentisphaerales bacterium M17dextr]
MRIRWENIIVPVLVILLVVLLFKMPVILHRFSDDFGTIYRGPGDPAVGLMGLGLICVTVVAIVKIIWGNRR